MLHRLLFLGSYCYSLLALRCRDDLTSFVSVDNNNIINRDPPAGVMTASAGALWKTSHLTLSGCLLAAITFVFFMGGNIMNLKLSRDSLDVSMAETSRELADLKFAFAALQQDNIRLWQIIDTMNALRPLPRASASLTYIAGAIVAAGGGALNSTANGTTYNGGTFISVSQASQHHVPNGGRGSTPNGDREGSSSPLPPSPPPVVTASAILSHGLKSSLSSSGPTKTITVAAAPTSSTTVTTPTRASAYAAAPSSIAVASAAAAALAATHTNNSVQAINEPETSQVGTNSVHGGNNTVGTLVPPLGTSLKQLASHPVTLELLKDALQSERSMSRDKQFIISVLVY
jgi:hypothetical protein